MNIKEGSFLKSSLLLNDSEFEQALIFITEYNAKGAMGFVINKPFARTLNELEEFRHSISFPLYDGGPVDREHLFCLHSRPDLIPGGTIIHHGIYLGGDFKQAVIHINNKIITANEIKIFIGYCGWDYAQLEEEIEEGSWEITEEIETVFTRT
jgi:putative transcriptional regulator